MVTNHTTLDKSAANEPELSQAIRKLALIEGELNSRLVERDEVIRGIILSIIARQHLVIIGPPGTAKSLAANEFLAHIEGAKSFAYLFTKFTTPEEIFGPISLTSLQKDRFERIVSGKIPDAHVTFADEVFKANSAILNSLLTIMNERKFNSGVTRINVPLLTLVGASNELPQDDSLAALYDRFMLRYVVSNISEESALSDLICKRGSSPSTRTMINLDEIIALQKKCHEVEIRQDVIEIMMRIKRDCEKSSIVVSDRRWIEFSDILRASALLDNRNFVETDDLIMLKHMLWSEERQRIQVDSIVAKHVKLRVSEALVIRAAIRDAVSNIINTIRDNNIDAQAATDNREIVESLLKLKAHEKRLNALIGGDKMEAIKRDIKREWREKLRQHLDIGA